MTITDNQKKLVGKVSMGALIAIIALPILAAAAGNFIPSNSNLEQLEANYKNAVALHEQSIVSEKNASKNKCFALSILASAKLVEVNKGTLQGDKEDLAKKASQDCFTEAK